MTGHNSIRQSLSRRSFPIAVLLCVLIIVCSVLSYGVVSFSLHEPFLAISGILNSALCFAMVTTMWHERRSSTNDFFLFISLGLLYANTGDILRIVTLTDVNSFRDTHQVSNVLNLYTNLLQSIVLFLAPFTLYKRFNIPTFLLIFTIITVGGFYSIFSLEHIYADQLGIVFLRRVLHSVCSILLSISLFYSYTHRHQFNSEVFGYVIGGTTIFLLSNILNSMSQVPGDFINMVGYGLITIGLFCFYRASILMVMKQSNQPDSPFSHSQKTVLADTQKSLVKIHEQKKIVQEESSKRQQALEAVYSLITTHDTSFENVKNNIVERIYEILHLDMCTLSLNTSHRPPTVTHMYNNQIIDDKDLNESCSFCPLLHDTIQPLQLTQQECTMLKKCDCYKRMPFESYIGVPIINDAMNPIGTICAMKSDDSGFSDDEIKLIEIFSSYIAFEISRSEMEERMQRTNEMKLLGQLTSGVAHEVRNPLNGLMTVTEALFNRLENQSEYQTYVWHIKKQVSRLSRLMEDLLALGRQPQLDEYSTFILSDIIDEAIKNWRQGSSENHIPISVNTISDSSLTKVWVDFMKIEQVLINLIDNASQFIDESGHISIRVSSKDSKSITIEVSDTGPGIDTSNLEMVLEPFYSTRKSGTGLGLSIVKKIIEDHGGTLQLSNNTLLKGLTVTFTLPVSGNHSKSS